MMATVVAEEELCLSCRIIFGRDLKVSPDFLQYLQLSGIKKAYRKKALEFHPDRGFSQSLTLQQGMANQFIDVHQAYEKLVAYLESRDRGIEPNISSYALSIQKDRNGVKRTHQNSTSSTKRFYRQKASGFQPKNNNGGHRKLHFMVLRMIPKLSTGVRCPIVSCYLGDIYITRASLTFIQ